MKGIVVFSGSAHHALADEICDHLEVPRSHVKISRFSNDCLQAQLLANCRPRDVYIVQPLVPPTQEHLMELLLMVVVMMVVVVVVVSRRRRSRR